jgi:hypothetical protein
MNETCQFCRKPVSTEGPDCIATCVLLQDTLFVEATDFPFDGQIFELDIAFYWCGVECFGRWIASRCALQSMEERAA